MAIKFKNNASSTLSAGITSVATSLSLSSGEGALFPTLSGSDVFYATLVDTSNNYEIVKVTARSSDTLTIVRAQDNTTARAFSGGDKFELRMTAVVAEEFYQRGEGTPLVADGVSGALAIADGGTNATTAAAALVNLGVQTSSTGSQKLPSGTTAQRDSSAYAGYIRFNSDDGNFEGYDGSAWGSIGGGATGSSGDAVFVENDSTVTASYTIPSGKNAMSTGPLTVNSGVAITVSSGSRFVVL